MSSVLSDELQDTMLDQISLGVLVHSQQAIVVSTRLIAGLDETAESWWWQHEERMAMQVGRNHTNLVENVRYERRVRVAYTRA